MSFFSNFKSAVASKLIRNEIVDCSKTVAKIVMDRQSQTKYYKNYNGFGKHDSVDFSDYGKKELTRLINDSISKKNDLVDLMMNPALPSVEFNLNLLYPMSLPDVSFERLSNNYEVKTMGRTIKVHEIGKIFIRFNAMDGHIQKAAKDKANIEALTVVFKDGWKVWPQTIIMNQSEDLKPGKTMEAILRSVNLVYFTIQFALKNRPTVFRDVTPRPIPEANPKKSKHVKSPVKVRRLVLDRDEAEELLAGHYTVQHEYKCNAWGVAGHWRHYKNGKVVWVRPYVKGKDRNKPEAYTPKVYELIKETKGVS